MSDEHIEHGIREILKARHVIGLHRLSVHARNGIAELRGFVESAHMRSLCIECSRRVTGVRQVIDCLDGG
jgi:osmotically-inducible protein OsmY